MEPRGKLNSPGSWADLCLSAKHLSTMLSVSQLRWFSKLTLSWVQESHYERRKIETWSGKRNRTVLMGKIKDGNTSSA